MRTLFTILALSVLSLAQAQTYQGVYRWVLPPFQGDHLILIIENNLTLTPGVVRMTDKAAICSQRTPALRHVSPADHRKVFALYKIGCGITCGKLYEVDHLISLEIGGSNDIQNLWPEPYLPIPGAHQKDILENKLHKMICSGQILPQQAQSEISHDWYQAYRKYVVKSDGKLGR